MRLRQTVCPWALLCGLSSVAVAVTLPTVDLGTSIHQATFNATGNFFAFSNIAYGEAPIADRRFKRPVFPITPNRTVNDGSVERICPQGVPLWQTTAVPPIPLPPGAAPPSGPPPGAAAAGAAGPDPRESEDCLLLDVFVPQAIFQAGQNAATTTLAPVLLWIHGGGFAQGSKSSSGNPAGLLAQGVADGRTGFIFVQINYRLGIFGFPPKGPQDIDVDPNSGLFDQQLALQWVQKNIRLFGGDATQVTVIGESAGAASILHQITAFGASSTTLFKRAIIQSPAERPGSDAALYAQVLQQTLTAGNITSVSQARQFTTAQMLALNAATIGAAPFGSFTFGPSIDSDFIPAASTVLLAEKKFASSLEIIVAHNSQEGLLFTDATVQNQTGLIANLQGLMPSIGIDKIQKIATTLYPDDLSGAQGYTTETQRLAQIMSEALVLCNANALSLAFGASSSGYQFSIFPGIHAEDVGYTFFNGPSSDFFGNPTDPAIAATLQGIIANFATSGKKNLVSLATQPESAGLISLGAEAFLNLDVGNITVVQDPGSTPRCQFWQQELYSAGGVTARGPESSGASPPVSGVLTQLLRRRNA